MLNSFIDRIFRLYTPIRETFQGDDTAFIASAVAHFCVGLGFMIFGFLCLTVRKETYPSQARKERLRITRLVGMVTFMCGISRLMYFVCLWYNYAILAIIFSTLTWISLFISIGYAPFVLKAVKSSATIEEVKESINETKERVNILTDLSKKIQERNK